MRWTLGFIFNPDCTQVLLIHKEHPEHQRGKWNGLGGKYEGEETGPQCIAREVAEESGLHIRAEQWRAMGLVRGPDWEMEVFTAIYTEQLSDAQTLTDERVEWFAVRDLPKTKRNLAWLIPLCIDKLIHHEIAQIDIQYTPKDTWK